MAHQVDALNAALADRYTIERELGAGGMAVVYLAHDLRHDRNVALKVMRPELAAVIGAERFLAEIRTTANLQHPHILALFDSGQVNGTVFYVMPFVEGESLRDRLTREKQLPIDDATRIAREVASALDYAHRHGVIHRDIKPENILLHDGQALVTDFGIALAASSAGGSRMTETGMSLGTPTYMSPEQAMGERTLDARTDVYALGCVLYEMLVGEPPFTGPTAQAIVAKVMTDTPRVLSELRRSVPPALEDAVATALEKLPADRWATAAQFADALSATDAAPRRTTVRSRAGVRRGSPRTARPVVLGGAAIVIAAGGVLAGRGLANESQARGVAAPSRLALFSPSEQLAIYGTSRGIDISPDGETIAYVATTATGDNIYLRRLDGAASAPIPGALNARNLRFSPDGKFVYSPRGSPVMQRIAVTGGTWTPIPEIPAGSNVVFGADGTAWWSVSRNGGVHRLRPGGKDELAFPPDANGIASFMQQILPGGRTALVVAGKSSTLTGRPAVMDLATGATTVVIDRPIVEVRYVPGYLVYATQDNGLHAIAFDPGTRKTSGDAVVIATDVAQSGGSLSQFAVSLNGNLVYLPTLGGELILLDRSGGERALLTKRNVHSPRFSLDGNRIAYDDAGADNRDVWIYDLTQGQTTRVTFDGDGHDPVWTRDGTAIAYTSLRSGKFGLYLAHPGREKPDSLRSLPEFGYTGTWMIDGTTLLSVGASADATTSTDILTASTGDAKPVEKFIATPYAESAPTISRDGKWLAYTSDQSGVVEVYVRPATRDGASVAVSVGGGAEPVWSRDGRELFYRGLNGTKPEINAAAMEFDPAPRVSKRTRLFSAAGLDISAQHANFDVSADGKSFVAVRRSPASYLVVIQNLPALIKRMESGVAR
ncbi:MAG TPA: protein kinase [Gemmatimonadaceae bacterium]|nr:protein kinase [Gemmatimonadaceae bacterium]